jgi:adenine-specific DNA-methyltransferase
MKLKKIGGEIKNIDIRTPLPMQYLGGKGRIVLEILKEIGTNFREQNTFIDLFTGSGIVAHNALLKGYNVYANDIQPYSSTLVKSLLTKTSKKIDEIVLTLTKLSPNNLFEDDREKYYEEYLTENNFIKSLESNLFDWKAYQLFCNNSPLIDGSETEVKRLQKEEKWTLFLSYYRNTYFGIKQCAEIDYLRELAESLDEQSKNHLLAAVISSLTYSSSSTTHLAQYLKPTTEKNTINLLKKRSLSIVSLVIDRLKNISKSEIINEGKVYNFDFRDALEKLQVDKSCIVYADPPYFKEHYSRYYHILDTFVLYDYPILTYNHLLKKTTVGRYRSERIVSDFGKKSLVRNAFNILLKSCKTKGNVLAISYACSSLVEKDFFIVSAKELGLKLNIVEFNLTHSGQGMSRHKEVTEYLFLFSHDNI